jgi:hypothetical protein
MEQSAMRLLDAFEAFYLEHRRCGDIHGGEREARRPSRDLACVPDLRGSDQC